MEITKQREGTKNKTRIFKAWEKSRMIITNKKKNEPDLRFSYILHDEENQFELSSVWRRIALYIGPIKTRRVRMEQNKIVSDFCRNLRKLERKLE